MRQPKSLRQLAAATVALSPRDLAFAFSPDLQLDARAIDRVLAETRPTMRSRRSQQGENPN